MQNVKTCLADLLVNKKMTDNAVEIAIVGCRTVISNTLVNAAEFMKQLPQLEAKVEAEEAQKNAEEKGNKSSREDNAGASEGAVHRARKKAE